MRKLSAEEAAQYDNMIKGAQQMSLEDLQQGRLFGYCRISTPKQKLQRQIDNIKAKYPDAAIVTEEYTGTTTNRPAWSKLEKQLRAGDVVVVDEVSRMSRNAAEGFDLCVKVFNAGGPLVSLKEPHINTEVYQNALQRRIDLDAKTGRAAIDKYISGQQDLLNGLLMDLAREQIALAFQSAEQEVNYLHQRTSEGVRKAQAAGKQVGRATGAKVETKKAKEAKERIRRLSRSFDGNLPDEDVIKICEIARNTYYKYKKEISLGQ